MQLIEGNERVRLVTPPEHTPPPQKMERWCLVGIIASQAGPLTRCVTNPNTTTYDSASRVATVASLVTVLAVPLLVLTGNYVEDAVEIRKRDRLSINIH